MTTLPPVTITPGLTLTTARDLLMAGRILIAPATNLSEARYWVTLGGECHIDFDGEDLTVDPDTFAYTLSMDLDTDAMPELPRCTCGIPVSICTRYAAEVSGHEDADATAPHGRDCFGRPLASESEYLNLWMSCGQRRHNPKVAR